MSTLIFVIKVEILGVLATVGCMFMGMGIAYFFDNLEKGGITNESENDLLCFIYD